MTFDGTVTATGQGLLNAKVEFNSAETGQTWRRFTDGNGYYNLAIENPGPQLKTGWLSVEADGFTTWTRLYQTVPTTDQRVDVPLVPFV